MEERLVGQGIEEVVDVDLGELRAHSPCRRRRRTGREDGEALGERPLVLIQQVPTPFHDGTQRAVARHRGSAPAREQPEAVVDPGGDRGHRQDAQPRRRQFDRQRQAVQPADDLDHGSDGRAVDDEARAGRGRPLGEELDGRRGHCLRRRRVDRRQAERRHGTEGLTGDVERLPARGEDPDPRASRQQIVDQLRRRRDHVLAVVDDEEHVRLGEGGEQASGRVGVVAVGGALQQLGDPVAEGGEDGLFDAVRLGDRCQLDEPHAVVDSAHPPRGDLVRQSCLAGATRAHERRQPTPLEHGVDPVDLVAASHEAADRGPQVAPRRRRRVGIRHPSVP